MAYCRSRGNPIVQTLVATELIPEAEPVVIEPLGLIPTVPASHMLLKAADDSGPQTNTTSSLQYVSHIFDVAPLLKPSPRSDIRSDEAVVHAKQSHISEPTSNGLVVESQNVRPDEVTNVPQNEEIEQAPLSSGERFDMQDTSVDIPTVYWSSSSQKISSQPTVKPILRSSHLRLSGSLQSSLASSSNAYIYSIPPPTKVQVMDTLDTYGLPSKIYQDPWYSKAIDAPDAPREYAGLLYHLKGGNGVSVLEEWSVDGSLSTLKGKGRETANNLKRRRKSLAPSAGWEYASSPPSPREVRRWLTTGAGQQLAKLDPRSQVSQHSRGFRNMLIAVLRLLVPLQRFLPLRKVNPPFIPQELLGSEKP